MDDIVIFFIWLTILFVVDFCLCWKWGASDDNSKARWFFLHAIANAGVVWCHWDEVVLVYTNPFECMNVVPDTSGTMIVLAIHVYHVVMFFKSLDILDWIHHILMCFVILPIGYSLRPGALLGHGAFWASGLPGGIDYVLLVLVKRKIIPVILEKRLNMHIQTWLRAPFCLFHSLLVWITFLQWKDTHPSFKENHMWVFYLLATFLTCLSYYWNAMYFCSRVITSHAIHVEFSRRISLKDSNEMKL